ncbi:hypothetical protein VTK73DRAFT_9619 [Phialemonium thermophilum]|uniref:Uncharacterized protein n=1 Tax=Phialemonium thermophilum TaxID=223376 RepID=A0ABR3XJN8_9PEZI
MGTTTESLTPASPFRANLKNRTSAGYHYSSAMVVVTTVLVAISVAMATLLVVVLVVHSRCLVPRLRRARERAQQNRLYGGGDEEGEIPMDDLPSNLTYPDAAITADRIRGNGHHGTFDSSRADLSTWRRGFPGH